MDRITQTPEIQESCASVDVSLDGILANLAQAREDLIDCDVAVDDARVDLERDFERMEQTLRERNRARVRMRNLLEMAITRVRLPDSGEEDEDALAAADDDADEIAGVSHMFGPEIAERFAAGLMRKRPGRA